MQRSKRTALLGSLFITVTIFNVVAVAASAAAKDINDVPPLFRENPNDRANAEIILEDTVNYRLPNDTVPLHYDIHLTTNVHSGDTDFSGTVNIDLIVVTETDRIVIHARELSDFVASIQSRDVASAPLLQMIPSYDGTREFLTLTPQTTDTRFSADTNWTLTIRYKGKLRADNGGFYLSTYTDENNKIRHLATTQFESTDARHGFPCYDEPAKRANFTITINHDPSYKAISNMPVDEANSNPGKTVFQTTPRMPTYLIAFVVSDFVWTEGVLNSLPQRIYSRPGTQHEQEWALVSGMLLMERLAEYYNVPFALPKSDQVAVPDFAAGAMENWGLSTYREEYMLYDKETSTVNTQTNIANVIAHEYCHQWFGDLVTIESWSYLWLKEGFATLFSYQATDEAYPEWGIYQMFHTDDYQRALNSDASKVLRPMTYYVQTPREISSVFDFISYSKAGSVLHMWQHALTDRVFRQGLHNYLTINQYSSAEENQLFDAIEIAAKEENYEIKERIRTMMSSWTRQGGYPLLTVERNYDKSSFTITQRTFYNDESNNETALWYIPVNYAVQSNPDFRDTEASHYLLKTPQITISNVNISNNDWLIVNKQSTGYYRINYDEQNWNLITKGLISKTYKIHPRNRAQLMHDAYSFASSNRLNHSILLNIMTYLKHEDQYAPWSTANSIINNFDKYLRGDAEYIHFKFFIADLVNNIYEKLGVNDVSGEQHYQKYTRSIAINLACLAGVDSCLQETNNKLKDQIENGVNIEPNLQAQTYCNGLRQSSNNEFTYVYDKLMNSEDQALRRVLISSLGFSEKESHIKTFVESSIDHSNKLRTQERSTLLSSAYTRGETGLLTSIDFLNDHWEAYSNLSSGFGGGNPLNSDIVGMSRQVVNSKQEKKLQELVSKVKNSDKVSKTLEETVNANIKLNFDWLERNRNPLMSWVSSYYNKDNTGGGSRSLSGSYCVTIAVVMLSIVMSLLY